MKRLAAQMVAQICFRPLVVNIAGRTRVILLNFLKAVPLRVLPELLSLLLELLSLLLMIMFTAPPINIKS